MEASNSAIRVMTPELLEKLKENVKHLYDELNLNNLDEPSKIEMLIQSCELRGKDIIKNYTERIKR